MSVSTFRDRVVASREDLLYTLKGTDAVSGKKAYWILLVRGPQKDEFDKALATGTFNLEQYGEIIESGFGTAVPELTKTLLRRRYGFELD